MVKAANLAIFAAVAVLSGCGGHYILTVPDQLAPAGGQATVVSRLQRNDFFVLSPAVREAVLRYNVPAGQERAAYTDKLGYAGTTAPAPRQLGRYHMRISHLDREGEEVFIEVPFYVWDAEREIVAVDLDCLPGRGSDRLEASRTALGRLAREANMFYLTRKRISRHGEAHDMLRSCGYPDGPVLLWRRQRWHVVRGRFKLPRVVVESRLVSQLAELRRTFRGLNVGVCDTAVAAKAFAAAGMRCVMLGQDDAEVDNLTRRRSWSQLAELGL